MREGASRSASPRNEGSGLNSNCILFSRWQATGRCAAGSLNGEGVSETHQFPMMAASGGIAHTDCNRQPYAAARRDAQARFKLQAHISS